MDYKLNWDLSQILNGSGDHPEQVEENLLTLKRNLLEFSPEVPRCIEPFQLLQSEIREASSLIACLSSIDVTNSKATALEMLLTEILALFEDLELKLGDALKNKSDQEFKQLIERYPELVFPLSEKREKAKQKLPFETESLINSLSVSGFHSMSTLYYSYIGELKFLLGDKTMSVSQIESHLDRPNRNERSSAFHCMQTTFQNHENIFTQLLNNILGYRLKVYEKRGYSTFLHETLESNRTSEATVRAMWDAVSSFKAPMRRYMDAKAKLLGLDKLAYYDLSAPAKTTEGHSVTWDRSCHLVIDLFNGLSPQMGSFAARALENGWIDAAVSPKKRAGGFCVDIPLLKESRILMSFQDSLSDQSTLAHELGHAYHNEVLFTRPPLLQELPMCLAETASTMCEMIVADNAIKQAKTSEEKLTLLDDKISRSAAFCMDLHSRFILDTSLHEERKKGFITATRLAELTEKAQKEGFANHLSEYFSHFFCYKMHFYFTDASFYNWSYTFGYLLSLGLYQEMQSNDFEKRYNAFLADTGAMTVEEIGRKHLGIDLTKSDFWAKALSSIESEIDTFVKLAENT